MVPPVVPVVPVPLAAAQEALRYRRGKAPDRWLVVLMGLCLSWGQRSPGIFSANHICGGQFLLLGASFLRSPPCIFSAIHICCGQCCQCARNSQKETRKASQAIKRCWPTLFPAIMEWKGRVTEQSSSKTVLSASMIVVRVFEETRGS